MHPSLQSAFTLAALRRIGNPDLRPPRFRRGRVAGAAEDAALAAALDNQKAAQKAFDDALTAQINGDGSLLPQAQINLTAATLAANAAAAAAGKAQGNTNVANSAGLSQSSRALSAGMMGADVAAWQTILGVPITSTFDAVTVSATKAFQSQKGLVADGVVGPKTKAAAGIGVAVPSGPPVGPPAPPPPAPPPPPVVVAPVATGMPFWKKALIGVAAAGAVVVAVDPKILTGKKH